MPVGSIHPVGQGLSILFGGERSKNTRPNQQRIVPAFLEKVKKHRKQQWARHAPSPPDMKPPNAAAFRSEAMAIWLEAIACLPSLRFALRVRAAAAAHRRGRRWPGAPRAGTARSPGWAPGNAGDGHDSAMTKRRRVRQSELVQACLDSVLRRCDLMVLKIKH